MLRINVREARRRLSELLDRVVGGEEVLLMRRGEGIAQLRRPPRSTRRLPSLTEFRASIGETASRSSTELLRDERDEH